MSSPLSTPSLFCCVPLDTRADKSSDHSPHLTARACRKIVSFLQAHLQEVSFVVFRRLPHVKAGKQSVWFAGDVDMDVKARTRMPIPC